MQPAKAWCLPHFLFFFVFMLLAHEVTAENPLPDTLDKIRASVVAIGTVQPIKQAPGKGKKKGLPVKFMGTGFVVGNGRQVITNLHVLPAELDSAGGEVLAVFAGRGEDAKATYATVKGTDPVHDLALLELTGEGLPPMKLSDDKSVREGSLAAFTGFPIGMVLGLYPATNQAIISAITPFVIPAHTSERLTAEQIQRLRHPFNVYQLDAIAYPGNSGSPLYDVKTGVVLGVVNSVFVKAGKENVLEKPSGIAYAIPVEYVNQLLKNNP